MSLTDDFDVRDYLDGISGLLGGTANVIMQLSWPEVGYGVVESTVESGQVMRHPVKRLRTTVTYLSVALLGTEDDRGAYRRAVNTSHTPVHSGPDSPVEYNAFDPELQLWVAACLFKGLEDSYELMHGPLDSAAREQLYQHSERLGTTLQVRAGMWPADRDAFELYWKDSLARVQIDDTVRSYLRALGEFRMLPTPLRQLVAWPYRLYLVGYLPQEFREQMGYEWSPRHQRRFERRMRVIGFVSGLLPRSLRIFPANLYLYDMRRRVRKNKPLV